MSLQSHHTEAAVAFEVLRLCKAFRASLSSPHCLELPAATAHPDDSEAEAQAGNLQKGAWYCADDSVAYCFGGGSSSSRNLSHQGFCMTGHFPREPCLNATKANIYMWIRRKSAFWALCWLVIFAESAQCLECLMSSAKITLAGEKWASIQVALYHITLGKLSVLNKVAQSVFQTWATITDSHKENNEKQRCWSCQKESLKTSLRKPNRKQGIIYLLGAN